VDTGQDQQSAARCQVWQGIQFLTSAKTEDSSAPQEKGNITAQLRRDLLSPIRGQHLAGENRQPNKHCSRIRRAAAKPRARGNALPEVKSDIPLDRKLFYDKAGCFLDQIIGYFRCSLEANLCGSTGRERNFKAIRNRDGLEDRSEFVVAIGAFKQNPQPKVQLCVGGHSRRARVHLSY
jgi:hypothetical protein